MIIATKIFALRMLTSSRFATSGVWYSSLPGVGFLLVASDASRVVFQLRFETCKLDIIVFDRLVLFSVLCANDCNGSWFEQHVLHDMGRNKVANRPEAERQAQDIAGSQHFIYCCRRSSNMQFDAHIFDRATHNT
eukprot:scaffold343_cov94-Cylindrotheca_fusiformis.AAC.2